VARVRGVVQHQRAEVGDELVVRHRLGREVADDRGAHLVRRDAAADWEVADALEQLGPDVDGVAAELAGAVGLPVQVRDGVRSRHQPSVRATRSASGSTMLRSSRARQSTASSYSNVCSWDSGCGYSHRP